MKFRAFLLVACMVVVPAAAMFSHHVPPAMRAMPSRLIATMGEWLATGGSRAPSRPVAEPARAAVASLTPAPFAGTAAEALTPTPRGSLEALGAVAIECRPLSGGTGHLASCRVPVDAAGQLQRVFQSQGSDADTALRGLADAVSAWRRPVAARLPTTTLR